MVLNHYRAGCLILSVGVLLGVGVALPLSRLRPFGVVVFRKAL